MEASVVAETKAGERLIENLEVFVIVQDGIVQGTARLMVLRLVRGEDLLVGGGVGKVLRASGEVLRTTIIY